jgi:hypothetical protein
MIDAQTPGITVSMSAFPFGVALTEESVRRKPMNPFLRSVQRASCYYVTDCNKKVFPLLNKMKKGCPSSGTHRPPLAVWCRFKPDFTQQPPRGKATIIPSGGETPNTTNMACVMGMS